MGKIYTNTPIQFLQIFPMRNGMNNQKIALAVVDVWLIAFYLSHSTHISSAYGVVVVNVCNTLLSFSGYWYIKPCPASLISTSHDPRIFVVISMN